LIAAPPTFNELLGHVGIGEGIVAGIATNRLEAG
jgi:hypothetical protein